MNFARSYRLPIAWMLFAFILFNGLDCAIGHGQMMGAKPAPAPSMAMAGQHDAMAHGDMHAGMHMPLPDAGDTQNAHDGMRSMFGDCVFASVLAWSLVFLASLSWLLRSPRRPLRRSFLPQGSSFRLFFPALNPRAP